MKQNLILSFITNDRPGVAETLAQIVSEYQGNWLESRLSQLGGKFAGIIHISIQEPHCTALKQALMALNQQGYQLQLDDSNSSEQASPIKHQLKAIGLDRSGIVKEITSALAQQGLNILECNTDLSSAAMSGETLFHAQIEFSVSADFSLDDIQAQLDNIATQLSIDIEWENDAKS